MSISSVSSNTNRITGLATGMDTDAMVKAALIAEQTKIDKANQDKQILEWQQEAYVDIIKDLKGLQDSYLDIIAPKDTNMMSSLTYAGSQATSGNEDILTATTLAGAINGTYEVKVEQIAEVAKKQSDFSLRSAVSNPIDVADWDGLSINIIIGTQSSESINLSSDPFSDLTELKNNINTEIGNNPNLKDKVTVVEEDGKIRIVSLVTDDVKIEGTPDSDLNTTIKNITTSTKLSEMGILDNSQIKITVNGKEFTVDVNKDKTLNEFMNELRNTKVTLNGKDEYLSSYITLNYSELTQKLTIETKETGANSSLKIEEVAGGTTASKLGILQTTEAKGQDAKVSIKPPGENQATTVTKSTNNFTIDNVTYSLKEAQGVTDDPIKLTVKPDATSAVEKFKKFIDKYNELIDKVNTKINEKKNYNYKPLTDEQKASMEEKDIEVWDSKAKQGLLKGDMQLRTILDQMRQTFYSTVEGAGVSITDIGISTSNVYLKGGKLEIDEAKLKAALETKGDQVQKLFTQSSDDKNKQGIFQKIKNILKGYIGTDGSLIKKAGYENSRWIASNDLSKGIEAKDKMIKELQTKFYTKQERYYQMYAKLETAMNQLNSQSNWLYSQLGMA